MTFLAALMIATGVGVLAYRLGAQRGRREGLHRGEVVRRRLADQVRDVEAMLHAERWDRRVDEARYAPVYQLDAHRDPEPTDPRAA